MDYLNSAETNGLETEYTITSQCPYCNASKNIQVKLKDYDNWQDGILAQEAFPYLSAEDREMVLTGICPQCWALYHDKPKNLSMA